MTKSRVIESNQVVSVQIGHMRCDGTHNIYIELQDGSDVELYGISKRVINQVKYNLTHPGMSIKFDKRFLIRSQDQWLSQNGINNK